MTQSDLIKDALFQRTNPKKNTAPVRPNLTSTGAKAGYYRPRLFPAVSEAGWTRN